MVGDDPLTSCAVQIWPGVGVGVAAAWPSWWVTQPLASARGSDTAEGTNLRPVSLATVGSVRLITFSALRVRPIPPSAGLRGSCCAVYYEARTGDALTEENKTVNMHPLMHPSLASRIHEQRASELQAEAANFRATSGKANPNRVERFFIKRREGKVTWIDTVLVQRSA